MKDNKVKWNDEFFTDEELNSYFESRIKESLISFVYNNREESGSSEEPVKYINKKRNNKFQHILPRYRVNNGGINNG